MNRSIVVGILEIMAVVCSLIGTYLLWGQAVTFLVAAAWCLLCSFLLTPSTRRRSTTVGG